MRTIAEQRPRSRSGKRSWSLLAQGVLTLAGSAAVLAGTIRVAVAQQPAAPPLVFDGVTVVDVEGGRLVAGQRVVIAGNHIRDVGAAAAIKPPKGARIVDAKGKYLIPGLWDMHVHVMNAPDIFYPLLIANGVTGIRDMHPGSSALDSMLKWRREILAGARVGPRTVVTGGFLSGSSAGQANAIAMSDEGFKAEIQIATPERARTVVDSLKAAGADFIKIRDGLSREVFFAIAAESRRIGIPLAGHFPRDAATAAEAADSGLRSFEHVLPSASCAVGHDSDCVALATKLRQNGAWVTPTFMLLRYFFGGPRPDRLRYWPASVRGAQVPSDTVPANVPPLLAEETAKVVARAYHVANMPFLAGTDAAVIFPQNTPGFSLQEEVEAFVEGGLPPLEALRTATLNPAKYFRATDTLGTVAPGKLADVVLLDADPLQDIKNIEKIRAVVANGRYFDRAALDRLMAEVLARAK